jgi:epoxyqueuosine reductase
LRQVILDRARSFGADLAGIAAVEDLSRTYEESGRGQADAVVWPEDARSVVVVAVAHPAGRPELDWWFGRVDPPGNRILAEVVRKTCAWVSSEMGLSSHHLPYHVERGGIYLKEAAALAGLGRIGMNNLLVTPEYGPRVRLRALTLDVELSPTGPTGFDPCAGCDAPCRRACPQDACLPDGIFRRSACGIQMDLDIENGEEQTVSGFPESIKVVKYCRACELSCRVGL